MSESRASSPALLSAPVALAWSLVLTLALSAAALLLAKVFGASSYSIVMLALVEVALYVGAAALLGMHYVGGQRRHALALGAATPLQLLIGGSLGVIAHLPAGFLDALVERRFPTPRARMLEHLAQITPDSTLHAIMLVVAIAVLAPLAEELFFRGALFSALCRKGPVVVAIWTTSIAFVLAHQEPRIWAPLLLVALLLSELRRHSGSVWPGFALHAAFNATTLASVFATRPTELAPPSLSWPLGAAGGVLCAAGVWVFARVSQKRALQEGAG